METLNIYGENDVFNIPIGTNFIFKNTYLFDDETETIIEPYCNYRYVYKGCRYNRELLFEITYFQENTWLPEDKKFKITSISSNDLYTCLKSKILFAKGPITHNIKNDIKNYHKEKTISKSICRQKNIPHELELKILSILGYANNIINI
jgi:hypothetical protein